MEFTIPDAKRLSSSFRFAILIDLSRKLVTVSLTFFSSSACKELVNESPSRNRRHRKVRTEESGVGPSAGKISIEAPSSFTPQKARRETLFITRGEQRALDGVCIFTK